MPEQFGLYFTLLFLPVLVSSRPNPTPSVSTGGVVFWRRKTPARFGLRLPASQSRLLRSLRCRRCLCCWKMCFFFFSLARSQCRRPSRWS